MAAFVCPECGRSFEQAGACAQDGAPLEVPSDPVLGHTIGNYRVARLIGAGGMGRVYKAVHSQIGSRVAIKVLSEECAKDRSLVERFFAEARAVNLIRHESIVNVLDISALPDGRPFIVMEFLDGEPVSAHVRRGAVPLRSLGRWAGEVLEGLGVAHDKGIIHRDLKSDNVFITRAGRAKILDFGIAKLVPEISSLQEGTRTGAVLGTPHYMSPEQALGRPVDPRSDLYSLGIILYEASTGRRPFDGTTLYELFKQHIEVRPHPPSALRADLPPPLEHVILRALEKSPSHRFQSAAEFKMALDQASAYITTDAWAPAAAAEPSAAYGRPSSSSGSGYGAALATPSGPAAVSASAPQLAYGPATPSASSYAAGAPAPAKKNPALWIALAGCGGLVALGGLVFAGVLVLGARAASEVVATGSTPGPTAAPDPVASPSPLFGGKPGPIQGDLDGKLLDVQAFLPKAAELAKRQYADAVLVAIDAVGITPKGVVDVSSPSNHVLYRFRSPEHSLPPADHPSNVPFESECLVYVMARAGSLNTFVTRWQCDLPLLGEPRCSFADVWAKAAKKGAPTGNVVGTFGWNGDGEGKTARWYAIVPPNFSAVFPDDC